MDLDADRCSPLFLDRIPRDFAWEHGILSQGVVADAELLVVASDARPAAVHNVGVCLGRKLTVEAVDRELVLPLIDAAYERHADTGLTSGSDAELAAGATHAIALVGDELGGEQLDLNHILQEAERDLLQSRGKGPVVKLVDRLLWLAARAGASDVHIQPLAHAVVIRQRVDGVLDDGHEIPRQVHQALVSRIKVMGRMDVAERLLPQDGRSSVHIGARTIDLRISSLPTAHGERVVIRLLDTTMQRCEFAQLGMPAALAEAFLREAHKNAGIILVTGPTGSGKTTSLYATLRELNSSERNIMTIEDPIEYELDSLGLPISQTQVNEKKGVHFANGLRHILRQDPDIIMVGEIRDAETARVAIQSSLTGHLVFSTMHTNDAPSAATRLIDLGVEPYLVAASLSCVLAQRLVRTFCQACGGQGCPTCGMSGYKGRTGVFEFMPVDDRIRSAIGQGLSLNELRSLARAQGMRSLVDAGQDLLAAGLTSAVEIERVVHG